MLHPVDSSSPPRRRCRCHCWHSRARRRRSANRCTDSRRRRSARGSSRSGTADARVAVAVADRARGEEAQRSKSMPAPRTQADLPWHERVGGKRQGNRSVRALQRETAKARAVGSASQGRDARLEVVELRGCNGERRRILGFGLVAQDFFQRLATPPGSLPEMNSRFIATREQVRLSGIESRADQLQVAQGEARTVERLGNAKRTVVRIQPERVFRSLRSRRNTWPTTRRRRAPTRTAGPTSARRAITRASPATSLPT